MDIALKELQAKVRNIALDARALSRVVESEAFNRAWAFSTDEQRSQLATYVVGIDKANVDKWVRRVLSAMSLEEKSTRELRDMAKAAGVNYVNNRTKDQLIELIRQEAMKPQAPGLVGDEP